jgi:hypothetical protein
MSRWMPHGARCLLHVVAGRFAATLPFLPRAAKVTAGEMNKPGPLQEIRLPKS